MKFNDMENNKYIEALKYISKHPRGEYIIEYGLDKIKCSFVTMFYTDNGLEPKDKKFDEFYGVVFYDKINDRDFELRSDYLPNKIYHESEKIFDLSGYTNKEKLNETNR